MPLFFTQKNGLKKVHTQSKKNKSLKMLLFLHKKMGSKRTHILKIES